MKKFVRMTKAMDWLKAKAPGFNNLSDEEVNAITDFSLLWSLFESRVLNRHANAAALCNAVEAWRNGGVFDPDLFNDEIAYFQRRYRPGTDFAHHFFGLRLQRSDREPMVRRVLDGSDDDVGHRLAAALISSIVTAIISSMVKNGNMNLRINSVTSMPRTRS